MIAGRRMRKIIHSKQFCLWGDAGIFSSDDKLAEGRLVCSRQPYILSHSIANMAGRCGYHLFFLRRLTMKRFT